jgi:hypothetical protein
MIQTLTDLKPALIAYARLAIKTTELPNVFIAQANVWNAFKIPPASSAKILEL